MNRNPPHLRKNKVAMSPVHAAFLAIGISSILAKTVGVLTVDLPGIKLTILDGIHDGLDAMRDLSDPAVLAVDLNQIAANASEVLEIEGQSLGDVYLAFQEGVDVVVDDASNADIILLNDLNTLEITEVSEVHFGDGFGGCYLCDCFTFIGNADFCMNCGHSYQRHSST